MDRYVHRYGAGKLPPLMVGRDRLIARWRRMLLDEVGAEGRDAAEDILLTGPRGVGKTCTVTAFSSEAVERGFEVVTLQAVRGESTLIGSVLRQAHESIAAQKGPWSRAKTAFERFAGAQIGAAGFTVGVNLHLGTTSGQADARDPESLAAALATVARAARDDARTGSGGLMLSVDELQVGAAGELAMLAATLQRLNVDHLDAPVVVAATGLPHTMRHLTEAGVTHPDRLFTEVQIPLQLELDDARAAIVEPARQRGVAWAPRAVDAVVEAANCYPAHLQFFGAAVWSAATGNRIELDVAEPAIQAGIDDLSARTLDPRWEQMAPREAELVTAIAAAGGHASVSTLEQALGRPQSSWSGPRGSLIEAGDLYSPRRGEIAVAVPALAPYALARYDELQRARSHLTSLQTMRDRILPSLRPPVA